MSEGWRRSEELESILEGVPSHFLALVALAYYPGGPKVDVGPDCLYTIRVVSEDDHRVSVFMFKDIDSVESGLQRLSDARG